MESKSNPSPLEHAGNGKPCYCSNSPSSKTTHYNYNVRMDGMGEKNSHTETTCRIMPEKGLMDMGSQGYGPSPFLTVKGDKGDLLIEDYGEAFLALLKGDYITAVKGSLMNNEVNCVENLQASMAATPSSKEDSLLTFLRSNYEQQNTMASFSCDEFRMYEFKVRKCTRGRSHDWTECPFAHPGEKARRRDPRHFHYSATACPDFRRGACKRGDACDLSHGVFECWLHPARYRTQLCKDGPSCKRRVCFFAHSPTQLRLASLQPIPSSVFKSRFPGFSDSTRKQPQYYCAVSPSKVASFDSYFTEALLEDFSPKSMHSFPDDGFSDALSPITNHSCISNNTHRHLKDGTFNNSGTRNRYGNGLSEDAKSEKSELNSIHHNYVRSLDDNTSMYQNSHVYSDSSSHNLPISFNGLCDNSTSKNSQAHVHLRTQLALATLATKFDHIMSPTSTLARHAFSPPLSPSDSPPMSPDIGFPRCDGLNRKMVGTLYGQSSPYDAPPSGTGIHLSRNNGNPVSTAPPLVPSNGAAMFVNSRGPSPLSTASVGDHPSSGHMLTALPSLHKIKEQRVETGLQQSQSTQAIAHLCSAYQVADVKDQRLAQPFNVIPESTWGADRGANWVQRDESVQGVRARIHGEEDVPDAENPDLGWVNDLVT